MPHKPYWYRDIPFIERWLEAIQEPVLDRRAIETVFRVSQSEATRILKRIGAWRLGTGLVVTRWQTQEWVRRVARGEDVARELDLRQRLEVTLERERRLLAGRQVAIRPIPAAPGIEGLPAGVRLAPGHLSIDFFGIEDLLKHLYALSQTLLADFSRFRQLVE